jgi:hypothetical protein
MAIAFLLENFWQNEYICWAKGGDFDLSEKRIDANRWFVEYEELGLVQQGNCKASTPKSNNFHAY